MKIGGTACSVTYWQSDSVCVCKLSPGIFPTHSAVVVSFGRFRPLLSLRAQTHSLNLFSHIGSKYKNECQTQLQRNEYPQEQLSGTFSGAIADSGILTLPFSYDRPSINYLQTVSNKCEVSSAHNPPPSPAP